MQVARPPRRPIRVLPPNVAARIAAGEVIERPASVVKELVENALDAGASRIRISVRGGGLHEIRVSDDGCGIPADELPLALQRHATSKLAEDDLERIETLGFRGEALPSIAAVAELTIASATSDAPVGRQLTVRDGRILADEPIAHPPGTTVTVRHLFEDLPARLAHVRNTRAEMAEIARVVQRLAIAAPHVRIALRIEDRVVLQTTGSGDRRVVLSELYGPSLASSLLPFGPLEIGDCSCSGFVSSPDLTRSSRRHLHVVVNGRWAQSRTVLALLEAAYRPLLPRGRHPVLVLVITADPAAVDVNIHPAKLEVRLRAERELGQAIAEEVRSLLARTPRRFTFLGATPAIDPVRAAIAETPRPYDRPETEEPILTPAFPPLRLIGQVRERLLLLEGPAMLLLVDQHRAHERVLYERLAAAHPSADDTVPLPEPLVIDVRPAYRDRFARWLDELAAYGFQAEPFGPRSFLVRTVPALPGVVAGPPELQDLGQPAALAPALLALLEESEDAWDDTSWRDRLLIQLACRLAVRRGRPLARPAMRALVQAWGATKTPAICPHGSPIVLRVEDETLAHQFDW
jgi:DNA mismatch repair protein MutL